MSKYIEYGLHPTLWRLIRKHHGGLAELDVSDSNGQILGKCMVSRYVSTIFLEKNIEFKSMSIKNLITEAKAASIGMCSPTIIPIGVQNVD